MPIDLYYMSMSTPCRAVLLAAKMVGVELNLKIVNLMEGEQMKPDFIKMNPQHTIPTLDDAGFILTESRAICGYLVNKYGKDDKLYPKSAKDRAVVDQRLYFDLGVFFSSFTDYYYPAIFAGAQSLNDAKKKKLDEALKFFNIFVSQNDFAAGDHLTIADLSLIASASSMESVNPKIFDDYPKIKEWMERCKNQIPDYYDLNQVGADILGHVGRRALAKLDILIRNTWVTRRAKRQRYNDELWAIAFILFVKIMAPKYFEKLTPEFLVCVITTLIIIASIAGMVCVSLNHSKNMEKCPRLCPPPKTQSSEDVDVSISSEKGTGSSLPTLTNGMKNETESQLVPESVPPFSTGKLGENSNFYF